MAEEILTFRNGDEELPVTVVENLCYCHDTSAWRDLVLLATQGGRKTTASRIGKRDGRLWNLPCPPGMSVARFADGEPAIFARPESEFNLTNCTRLQMYRKYLAPNGQGVTFDLTRGKDLICALPYRDLGDVEWSILVAFKKDSEKSVMWFMSKEIFRLSHGQEGVLLQKSVKPRPRETLQLPPMEERESGDGADIEQTFVERGYTEAVAMDEDQTLTREGRSESFNTICASVMPQHQQQQQQQHPEHDAILHDLLSSTADASSSQHMLVQGTIVRCRFDGSEAHGRILSVSPWDAVIDFGATRNIVSRNDILAVVSASGEIIDVRPHGQRHDGMAPLAAVGAAAHAPTSSHVADELSFQLPEVPSMPFAFGDFQPSPLAPNWLSSLGLEGLGEPQHLGAFAAPSHKAGIHGGMFVQGLEASPAFLQDFGFAHMESADPHMFVSSHEGLESALGHLDVFFPRSDGMSYN